MRESHAGMFNWIIDTTLKKFVKTTDITSLH